MTADHICLDCKVSLSDRDPQTKRCFDCAAEAQRDSKRRRMAKPENRNFEKEYKKKGRARRRAKKRSQAFSKALGI